MKVPKFTAEDSIYKTSQSYQFQKVSERQVGGYQIVVSQLRSNFGCDDCIFACIFGSVFSCAVCITLCDIKDAN
jgi:hypothetical protein